MKFITKTMNEIILASKSKVRKEILNLNGINCKVFPSNIDEDTVKYSLIKEKASPEIISKNLNFSEKANVYYRLERLIDDQQMGNLFKVMLIKNKKNKFNIGL